MSPRLAWLVAGTFLTCVQTSAQQVMRPMKVPGPVRDAGTYHAATGRWIRTPASPAISATKIYTADIPSGYFGAGWETAEGVDEGILPGTANAEFGNAGTSDQYVVDGFSFGYCTFETGALDWEVELYDSYTPCDDPDLPANCLNSAGTVVISGAPGGAGIPCWIVTVDLSGGAEIVLRADGGPCNPGHQGAATGLDHFGWGLTLDPATYTGVSTGPFLQGYDPAWALPGEGTCYNPGPGCAGNGTFMGAGSGDLFGVGTPFNGCFFFGGYKNLNGCGAAFQVPPGQMNFTLFAECEDCGDFRDQPPFEFSTISVHDSKLGPWDDITDAELAGWLKEHLEPNDTVNYQDIKFVTNTCFGGGLLDDLKILSGTWIGSSASRYDESAKAYVTDGMSGYTKAWTESTEKDMKDRHDDAAANDPFHPDNYTGSRDPENPQVTGEGDWKDIELGGALSRHAILFSGETEERHWNNMMAVREDLLACGFPADNIKIYSGDGSKGPGADAGDPDPDGEGTKDELEQAIEDVAPLMNPDEQLFLYITDHGDSHCLIEELEKLIKPFTSWLENFTVPDYILEGMGLADPPGPDLSLATENVIVGTNEVILNGQLIGFLSVTGAGNQGTDSFSIDPSQLDPFSNTIEVKSQQGQDLLISLVSVGTGPVPDILEADPACNIITYCNPDDGNPGNVATISATGCDLSLPASVDAANVPPGQNGYLIVGGGTGTATPNQGTLCVLGGPCIGRYNGDVQTSGAAGTYSTDISNSVTGGPGYGLPPACSGNIQAGETWYFQYWHRLPAGGGDTFSEAICITFN